VIWRRLTSFTINAVVTILEGLRAQRLAERAAKAGGGR
jgi:hypothetical protein